MASVGDVLIVGGGISGMALAIGLRQTGIRAEIVELSCDWSVLGVGISLQGPALRALKVVGVIDRCVGAGFGYSYFKAGDVDSNVTATVDLPQINGPHYPAAIGIMRQELQKVLQEELAQTKVPVRLGVTVSSLRQDDHGVDVEFTDGTKGRYGLVVGADGANSMIRDIVIGREARPTFTGQAGALFILRAAQQGWLQPCVAVADVCLSGAERSRQPAPTGRQAAGDNARGACGFPWPDG